MEENPNIVQETQPTIEGPQENNVVNPEEKPEAREPVAKAAQEDQDQINHTALRELKQKAERERDEALNRYKELEARYRKPQEEQQPVEAEQDFSVAPDDLVEGKHLSAVDKKIKKLEQQLQAYQQNAATQTVETKIRSQYPDFDSVVSKENIDILRTAYPEIATAIGSSQDLYSKAISAYRLIKKFGIHQDKNYSADVSRVKENLSKPVPTASLGAQQGESPLTKANAFAEGLTPELKKKLYKETLEAAKGY